MTVVVSNDKCVRGHLKGVASGLYYKALKQGYTKEAALEYTRHGLYLYQRKMPVEQIARLHNCDCDCNFIVTNRRVLKKLEHDNQMSKMRNRN